MLNEKLLTAGLISGLALGFMTGCGSGKLKISEVCFVASDKPACVCFVPDKKEADILPLQHCDRYQAMSPDDAAKVKGFINKCLKYGVRP